MLHFRKRETFRDLRLAKPHRDFFLERFEFILHLRINVALFLCYLPFSAGVCNDEPVGFSVLARKKHHQILRLTFIRLLLILCLGFNQVALVWAVRTCVIIVRNIAAENCRCWIFCVLRLQTGIESQVCRLVSLLSTLGLYVISTVGFHEF